MDRALRAYMFKGHPYEHAVIGFKEDVFNMLNSYEHLKSFYQKEYKPDKTLLFIAGNMKNPGNILSIAESLFSK
ncbi:MAG: insulinase family protein [Candidatus Marinimicrobia bacterium]|nr:insulinase family protein [Candidatus Neomarinimicrobiota bacterium]MDD5582405.1 insulinase family protein [Candidatus Neomarinimicrobiota bacterium]